MKLILRIILVCSIALFSRLSVAQQANLLISEPQMVRSEAGKRLTCDPLIKLHIVEKYTR